MSFKPKEMMSLRTAIVALGLLPLGCDFRGFGGSVRGSAVELAANPSQEEQQSKPSATPEQTTEKVNGEPAFEGVPLSKWIAQLQSPQVEQRKEALRALSAIGPEAKSALAEVRKLLQDSDADVQEWACSTLGRIGVAAQVAVPDLEKIILNPAAADKVRWAAAIALGNIGPAAASATPTLLKALQDSDPWLRWAATEGLSGIGPDAKGAAKPLADALYDSEYVVRIGAARALVHLAPQVRTNREALSAMIRCYEDTSQFDSVRQKIAEAIKEADPKLAVKLGIK